MKASGKGVGCKTNPNSKSVFNAIKVSAGKSSGGVNSKFSATKVSSGKSSGHVNKPVPAPKKKHTVMKRGY
jgi:hypothetical protein